MMKTFLVNRQKVTTEISTIRVRADSEEDAREAAETGFGTVDQESPAYRSEATTFLNVVAAERRAVVNWDKQGRLGNMSDAELDEQLGVMPPGR